MLLRWIVMLISINWKAQNRNLISFPGEREEKKKKKSKTKNISNFSLPSFLRGQMSSFYKIKTKHSFVHSGVFVWFSQIWTTGIWQVNRQIKSPSARYKESRWDSWPAQYLCEPLTEWEERANGPAALPS